MKGCSNELREVLGSLTSKPKFIAPKYFYDERGSRLFEVITRLPEYYLTRTEMAILDRCLPDIRDAIGQGVCLVEYGAGSSLKVRRLLETLRPDTYLPVDISHRHLERTAAELHADYPWLKVYPTWANSRASPPPAGSPAAAPRPESQCLWPSSGTRSSPGW